MTVINDFISGKFNKLHFKKYVCFIIAVLLHQFSFSQDHNGFYGKKNFIELSSASYLPILKNIANPFGTSYEKLGTTLSPGFDDWFNTGFRISIGRASNNNRAWSIEYGSDFWSTPMSDISNFLSPNAPGYFNITKHEKLKMHTAIFMPKIHLAPKSALMPMGINHELGIGLTRSKIIKDEYVYILDEGSVDPLSSAKYLDFDRVYYGIQFLYGLRMRKPLNYHFMLNYGFRYTADVQVSSSSPHAGYDELYSTSNYKVQERVRFNLSMNVLSFDLGITYAF